MRAPTPIHESDFQAQLVQLAELLGWAWIHHRPARTVDGWRTPASGPLAKGWPDLELVRQRDRRLIYAELKSERGRTDADQDEVLEFLAALGDAEPPACANQHPIDLRRRRPSRALCCPTWIQIRVWRPSDWSEIEEELR